MALALDIDAIKHNLGFWDVDPIASGLQARALATAMTEQHLSDGYDVVIGQHLARPDFIEALDALAARCSASFIETVLCAWMPRPSERGSSRDACTPIVPSTQ